MTTAGSVGPYTPILRAGDWLVVSGQVGLSEGNLVTGGVQAELRQALANLASLLASQGASLQEVVKTTVFLMHIDDYPAMNTTYGEVFGDHRPARSAVAVAALPLGALVEVEAWGYVGARNEPAAAQAAAMEASEGAEPTGDAGLVGGAG